MSSRVVRQGKQRADNKKSNTRLVGHNNVLDLAIGKELVQTQRARFAAQKLAGDEVNRFRRRRGCAVGIAGDCIACVRRRALAVRAERQTAFSGLTRSELTDWD